MLRTTTKMKSLRIAAFAIAMSMMPGFVQAQNLSTQGIAGTWEGKVKFPGIRDMVSPTSMTITPAASGKEAGQVRWQLGKGVCVFKLHYRSGQNSNYSFDLKKAVEGMSKRCLVAHGGELTMTVSGGTATWVVTVNNRSRLENNGAVKKVGR